MAASAELQAQLKLQDEAAVAMRAERVRQGALEFNRMEADPVVVDGKVHEIKTAYHNRATELIEELMIAANETMARTLRAAQAVVHSQGGAVAGAVGADCGAGGAAWDGAAGESRILVR